MQTLVDFFGIQNFIPHGYCLSWDSALLWMHVTSDILITLSYYSIPLSLLYFVRQRKKMPYAWLVLIFGLFIVACGTTHLMSAVLIWIPLYWFDGYLKVLTAIVSVATAIAMLRIIPLALKLPSAEQLQAEINERKKAQHEAQEASDRLHKIANQLHSVVFQFRMRVDGSFCIPYANHALQQIFRFSPEEVRDDAACIFTVVHPDDLEQLMEGIEKSARELSPWVDEYRLKFEDGTERWLWGNSIPQREADGSILWHGFVSDITERKKFEVDLQKESHKTLALLRNASDGISIINEQGNIVECSDSFCNMLGYSREEIIGMHVSEWDVGIPEKELMTFVGELFKQKSPAEFETKHIRKDGTIYDAELSGCPVQFGEDWVYFCSTRNVTERKQMEKSLLESEFRWKFAVKGSGDGLWDWNIPESKVFFSSCWKAMLGFNVDEIGDSLDEWVERVHPDDKEKTMTAVQNYLEGKTENYIDEHRVLCKDGSYKWILDRGMIVNRERDGVPLRMIGTHTDISESKKMEAELKRSNTELEQFAYAVSHDMRQPLRMVTSYLGLVERALQTQLDDDTREFLNFALDGAKRMDSMILSLLDYSRVGKQHEALTVISTQKALDEALLFLQPAAETSGGKIEVSGDWIDLVANRDELTRLLQNLIGNALKYHKENEPPHVKVLAMMTANKFRVEVHDNGIGIEPNQKNRLFKVFSRLQARSRFEGTGVGLALCRKIVEHHGGEIGVNSAGDGHGCVFWFEIPIAGQKSRT